MIIFQRLLELPHILLDRYINFYFLMLHLKTLRWLFYRLILLNNEIFVKRNVWMKFTFVISQFYI